MSNQSLYTMFLFDLPLEEQELLSGGQNSDDEDSDSDKFKYKDKDKQKDKNITDFLIYQKDISGTVEINLNISM
ncbi:hypothetical protein [Nodularia sphaerocarpa]|uniref:hypothetical protein n=1 Tax=Nodularia sphaerocarpa TaxID=137816 RepID=UPI001EFB917E|nr:hypothetical protein [Nodularia sphaerocarpa]MDB9374327.1 hypothetical protein [Nodularia sphaerocarpa CS-585]MDB9379014.1 hypothetical protein [Nodularia sphaerocarpa CS-585A2]ULP73892.1 hypothetical protein BDGGKGIB_03552 [Nodularia sphaerocarpa UHCC 0038]